MGRFALRVQMTRVILFLTVVVFSLQLSALRCFAGNSAGLVNKANGLYKQKKYDQAIKLYNEAQIKSPEAAEIYYDIGAAQYKKEDYSSAVSSFEKATVSKDKALESRANFNIGNAKYKLGKLKENTDLKETVNLLRQSLDYYKRAIELEPKDEDARINHELVEKELKALLDKLKKEQENKNSQSGKSEEKKSGKEQQEGSQGQQGQQESRAEKQQVGQQQGQESNPEGQAKPVEEHKDSQGKEQKIAGAEEAKEMSKQEANMLLEGYRQEENSSGKLEDRKKGFSGEVLKDW